MKTVLKSATIALSFYISLHADIPGNIQTIAQQIPAMEKSVENIHEAAKQVTKLNRSLGNRFARCRAHCVRTALKVYADCQEWPVPFVCGIGVGLIGMYLYMRSTRTVPTPPKNLPKSAQSPARKNLMSSIRQEPTLKRWAKSRKTNLKPKQSRSTNIFSELKATLEDRRQDIEKPLD